MVSTGPCAGAMRGLQMSYAAGSPAASERPTNGQFPFGGSGFGADRERLGLRSGHAQASRLWQSEAFGPRTRGRLRLLAEGPRRLILTGALRPSVT